VTFLETLHARAAHRPRRILFPEAADPRTRAAVLELKATGVVDPVIVGTGSVAMPGIDLIDVGDPSISTEVAEQLLVIRGPKGMTLEEATEHSASPLLVADAMVRLGRADGCVAGAVHTSAEVVRAALWLIGPAPGVRTISSAFYMDVQPIS
jgi:phosphate acetyltransferase